MIIIYGRRSYGRVDEHGGEYGQTSFVHIYFVPLVPTGSMWVTRSHGDQALGIEIPLSLKSVAATYLRCWGPLAAIIAFVSMPGMVLGAAAAIPLLAASGWSWTWRSLRGETAHRRSDFNLLAFGTRCEPARMSRVLQDQLKTALDEQWRALGLGRPPEDTAQYGAKSREEAVTAYGLLRLAGLQHSEAGAAADRILEGATDTAAENSPYRESAGAAIPPKSVLMPDIAAAAATQTAQAATAAAPMLAPPKPWSRRQVTWAVLGVAALIAVFGLFEHGSVLLGVSNVGGTELAASPATDRWVEVRCDQIEEVAKFTNGDHAYACYVQDRVLPVSGELAETHAGMVITGKLHDITDDKNVVWPEVVRSSPQVFRVYCELDSATTARAAAIGFAVLLLAALGAAGFIVWRHRLWEHPRARLKL